MKYNFTFSDETIEQLRNERYDNIDPLIQRKMEALLLKSHGLSHKQIGNIVGITQATLRRYFNQYELGGIAELKKLSYYNPTSKMENHASTIEEEFSKKPPATLKEAAARIEELTGIKCSTVQVSKFLKKKGLTVAKQRKSQQKPTQKNKGYFWIKS